MPPGAEGKGRRRETRVGARDAGASRAAGTFSSFFTIPIFYFHRTKLRDDEGLKTQMRHEPTGIFSFLLQITSVATTTITNSTRSNAARPPPSPSK